MGVEMVIQTDMDSKRHNDQGRYLSKSAEQSSEPGCGLKTVTLPLPLPVIAVCLLQTYEQDVYWYSYQPVLLLARIIVREVIYSVLDAIKNQSRGQQNGS